MSYERKVCLTIASLAILLVSSQASEPVTRKTPIAIYIGDHDQFSSLTAGRRTRDLLSQEKFPIEYVEIKDHDHNYWDVAGRINPRAVHFFEEHPLPTF